MLPFTTPDEPLYLVYAINRVIQVKAGQLEAKLKALTLHLLQRGAPRGNGVIKEDHAAPPFTRGMALVDLNGTIEPETAFRPAPNYMAAMDLNGAIEQDPADEYVSNQDTMLEAKIGKSSGSSSGISIDDVQIIQVFKFLSRLSNQIDCYVYCYCCFHDYNLLSCLFALLFEGRLPGSYCIAASFETEETPKNCV